MIEKKVYEDWAFSENEDEKVARDDGKVCRL